MKKLCCLALITLVLAAFTTGCTTDARGDREFIPGKGWEPVQ